MTGESILTIVNTVGFPIACVLICMFFIKYMYDGNAVQTKEFTDAINSLTIAFNKLSTKLGKDDSNEN